MSIYKIDDKVVDSENAVALWEEDTTWDGSNSISVNTGTQWEHEQLYKSRKGNYWLEHWSQWQGSRAWAEFVPAEEAAKWLMLNGKDLPADLAKHEKAVCE